MLGQIFRENLLTPNGTDDLQAIRILNFGENVREHARVLVIFDHAGLLCSVRRRSELGDHGLLAAFLKKIKIRWLILLNVLLNILIVGVPGIAVGVEKHDINEVFKRRWNIVDINLRTFVRILVPSNPYLLQIINGKEIITTSVNRNWK